jgi:hypothetical protein
MLHGILAKGLGLKNTAGRAGISTLGEIDPLACPDQSVQVKVDG